MPLDFSNKKGKWITLRNGVRLFLEEGRTIEETFQNSMNLNVRVPVDPFILSLPEYKSWHAEIAPDSNNFAFLPDSDTEKSIMDFFDKTSNSKQLTDRAADSITRYAVDAYISGKLARRDFHTGNIEKLSVYQREMIKHLDSLTDRSNFTKSFKVTRLSNGNLLGIKGQVFSFESLKELEGAYIHSFGYLSCCVADKGLALRDSSKQFQYNIYIPPNSRGAGIFLGYKNINRLKGISQREFLTGRDGIYKIGKIKDFDTVKKIYEIDLYYIGRYEHDEE